MAESDLQIYASCPFCEWEFAIESDAFLVICSRCSKRFIPESTTIELADGTTHVTFEELKVYQLHKTKIKRLKPREKASTFSPESYSKSDPIFQTPQGLSSCPFCNFESPLPLNALVVSCLQCLKRFVPEFKKIIPPQLLNADATFPSPLHTKDPKTTTALPIFEEKQEENKEKNDLASLPLFEDSDQIQQGLLISPKKITSFQTFFDTEIRSLTAISSPKSLLEEQENLEGESLIGQILFKIQNKIAEGGMGNIYRAKMICADGFEKTVALKMLRPMYARDPKLLSMFISEARVMAELKHNNVVTIHAFGKFRELYFYAMEYIEGRDLAAFQERHQRFNRAAPVGLLVYIIAQICNALNYIHTKRDKRGKPLELIHRDISPQNIMFSKDGVVKIMDFGVAKGKPIATSVHKAIAGKLNYIAPEIALFQEFDYRADIYSLGVVFYELITGRVPFQWNNHIELNQNIEHVECKPPRHYCPQIPEDLERIILKALAKDPKNRWADAATMHFALNHFLYSRGLLFNEQTLANYLKGIFKSLGRTGIETSKAEDEVDLQLVHSIIEENLINRNQLKDCLREQADFNSRGEHINLGALFVRKNFISLKQFQELLQRISIQVLRCPNCGNQYYVKQKKAPSLCDCLRCASALELPEHLTSALVDGHLHFEEEQD